MRILPAMALPLPLLLAALLAPAPPVDDEAPQVERAAHGWVEYLPGEAPLILLAPHGGDLRPPEVQDRSEGSLRTDLRTLELAQELAAAFEARTGQRPHVVACRLHRSKLDANRDAGEAAQGDAGALEAWHAWHAFVERAAAAVAREHGRGLLVDVHGQSHEEGWVELGYALSARQLAQGDDALHLDARPVGSTVDGLARRHGGDRAALVRGPASLGALLQAAGYRAVPSPAHPHPDGGRYYDGGYNVRRHGSRARDDGDDDSGDRNATPIDAIQLEVPRHLRDDATRRRRLAADVAGSLATFLGRWYGYEPPGPKEKR